MVAKHFYSESMIIINVDKLRVERSVVSLIIANVIFSVISGRLAKMEIEQRVSKLKIFVIDGLGIDSKLIM